jgi:hypothetical protein
VKKIIILGLLLFFLWGAVCNCSGGMEDFYGYEWVYFVCSSIRDKYANEYMYFIFNRIHFEKDKLCFYALEAVATSDGAAIVRVLSEAAREYDFKIECDSIIIEEIGITLYINADGDFVLDGAKVFMKQRMRIPGTEDC